MVRGVTHIEAQMCATHRMYWQQEGTDSPLYAERCPMAWTKDEPCVLERRWMVHLNHGPFHDCVMEPNTR